MSTPVRVGAFVAALALAFLGALGVGRAVGPLDAEPAPGAHGGDHAAGGDGHAHGGSDDATAADHLPGGLEVSSQGYTLRVLSLPRQGRLMRFVVEGPDGEPVTAFDRVHERPLHLISVRRDGAGYEHLHPQMSSNGTWSVDATFRPGTTRLLADFTPTGGPELVLGTDVDVAGRYVPVTAPPEIRVFRTGPYRVELTGDLVAGESSPLTATVTRRGEPVTDLQPYLGAYGHLVALREGDLAYLHVHPEEAGPGPEIPFVAEVPSEGRYRLYLDFLHDDRVRTAELVLGTTDSPSTDAASGSSDEDAHGGEDHDH